MFRRFVVLAALGVMISLSGSSAFGQFIGPGASNLGFGFGYGAVGGVAAPGAVAYVGGYYGYGIPAYGYYGAFNSPYVSYGGLYGPGFTSVPQTYNAMGPLMQTIQRSAVPPRRSRRR
jgi:hypothetical protein